MPKVNPETPILKRVMLAATKMGARLFRNNVGFDEVRKIHYGLCKGSSDLIGWRPVTITPEMVGTTIAQFYAVEVKTSTGEITEEQQRFIDAVNKYGGCAVVARHQDDLLRTREGER